MLIELLIVTTLLIVVVGATFTLLEVGTRSAARNQEFALEISDSEAGLSRMVHEIRQASSVTATTPNSIDFLITTGGQSVRVFYECDVPRPSSSFRQCVRVSVAAGGTLPAISTGTVIVGRVANGTLADPVFSFQPDAIAPTYVDAKLELPAAGSLTGGRGLSHSTVLDSGAYLRNLDVGA